MNMKANGMGAASLNALLDEIAAERARQDAKWGALGPDDDERTRRMLGATKDLEAAKSLARYWQDTNDTAARQGAITWQGILLEEVFEALAEPDPVRLRAELVQVAAVAVKIAQAVERLTAVAEPLSPVMQRLVERVQADAECVGCLKGVDLTNEADVEAALLFAVWRGARVTEVPGGKSDE